MPGNEEIISEVEKSKIVQIYDNYDHAFADWASFYSYRPDDPKDKAKRIPSVFATPSRAFAQMERLLNQNRDRTFVKTTQMNPNTVPLPFLSYSRHSFRFDEERYRYGSLTKGYQTLDKVKWVGMRMPYPVVISYSMDVWASTLRQLTSIKEQVALKFPLGSYSYLEIMHPEPFGKELIRITWDDWVDNSDLEPGSENSRTLRQTYTFSLYGWIVGPVKITPAVLSIWAQLYVRSNDTDELVLEKQLA